VRKKGLQDNEPASESGRYKGVLDGLELGVGVRADLAVQVDLFVLRGNPFHERCSLRELNDVEEDSTISLQRNRENPVSQPSRRGPNAGIPQERSALGRQNQGTRNRFVA
jgi:hypothetical protein